MNKNELHSIFFFSLFHSDHFIFLCTSKQTSKNNSDIWNRNLVLQTFTEEDAARIFRIKPKISQEDLYCWGFTKDGLYSTQSGYKLTEAIIEMNHPGRGALPPLEKKL